MASSDLKVTIVTGASGQLDLSQEIRLVGPALLYADEVSLISPGAQILGDMHALHSLSFHERLQLVVMAMPDVNSTADFNRKWQEITRAEAIAGMSRTQRRQRYSPTEQEQWREGKRAWEQFRSDIEDVWERQVKPELEAQYEASRAAELAPAVNQGLLRVERVSLDSVWSTDTIIEDLFTRLSQILETNTEYPLLDPSISNLVRLALKEKKIVVQPTAEERAYEATAAATFMNALPILPSASIEELLELRKELAKPLVNFRKALYEMRQTATISPFSPDIEMHLQDVYARSVVPAIEDIKMSLKSNGILRHVRSAIREDIRTLISLPSAAGLILVNDSLTGAQQDIFSGLIAAAAVSHVGASAWEKEREARDELEQRAMYFLYKADDNASRLGR